MHVAVDRVTGGAAEGMLFSNTVLIAGADGKSPVFEVTMRIEKPKSDNAHQRWRDDMRWLAATLQALHLGILRVGSSKSSGRLELLDMPTVAGPSEMTQPFTELHIEK